MSFMRLDVQHFSAYVVETTEGSEIVPLAACGTLHSAHMVGSEGDNADVCDKLATYCNGEPQSYKVIQGWFARYSAPGYLDCTDWCGPYADKQAAVDACEDLYGE